MATERQGRTANDAAVQHARRLLVRRFHVAPTSSTCCDEIKKRPPSDEANSSALRT